jgi:hypothetical protein
LAAYGDNALIDGSPDAGPNPAHLDQCPDDRGVQEMLDATGSQGEPMPKGRLGRIQLHTKKTL